MKQKIKKFLFRKEEIPRDEFLSSVSSSLAAAECKKKFLRESGSSTIKNIHIYFSYPWNERSEKKKLFSIKKRRERAEKISSFEQKTFFRVSFAAFDADLETSTRLSLFAQSIYMRANTYFLYIQVVS